MREGESATFRMKAGHFNYFSDLYVNFITILIGKIEPDAEAVASGHKEVEECKATTLFRCWTYLGWGLFATHDCFDVLVRDSLGLLSESQAVIIRVMEGKCAVSPILISDFRFKRYTTCFDGLE